MTLALTPDMIEATYDLLKTMPPFRAWRLPPSDSIVFCVSATSHQADFNHSPLCIGISSRRVGSIYRLVVCMAHELCHLRLHLTKRDRGCGVHGARFQHLAAQVCKIHGFDVREF